MLDAAEFPVSVGATHTRIDFVLAQRHNLGGGFGHRIVAECKRVNPALGEWHFAKASYISRHADAGDLVFDSLSPEVPATCARHDGRRPVFAVAHEARVDVRGDTQGAARGAIEDAAGQVLRGVNGLIEHLSEGENRLPEACSVEIVPVIFTTARLLTASTDLATADLTTGRVPVEAGDLREVQWLWYRYHASNALLHSRERRPLDIGRRECYEGLTPTLESRYARTIAIVRPEGIDDFFRALPL